MTRLARLSIVGALVLAPTITLAGQAQRPGALASSTPQSRSAVLKIQTSETIDTMAKQIQVMVDSVFSFGELGFQEVETSKYLMGILEQNGFTVTRGIAGIPTAWTATWDSGKPVIALESDIDGIPQASQKPGVAYRDPISRTRPATARGTTAECRSTSSRRWP